MAMDTSMTSSAMTSITKIRIHVTIMVTGRMLQARSEQEETIPSV